MEEEKAPDKVVFDSAAKFNVKAVTSEGIKSISVRFPTDEEWNSWHSRKKYEVVSRGGNITETVIGAGAEEVDAELLTAIRPDQSPEIEPYHAGLVCGKLAQADIVDTERDGDLFVISLRVPGGITTHRLAMPDAKQWQKYDQKFGRVFNEGGKRRIVTDLNVAGALYGKLCQKALGYPASSNGSGVPIMHKAAAVQGVMGALKAELNGDIDF